MENSNWNITPQMLTLIVVIIVLVVFNLSQHNQISKKDIEYALTIDSLQRGREEALAKADTAMKNFMIIDALLDSVKHAYPQYEENINNINSFYDEKLHGLDTLSNDSLQSLLSGN